MSRAVYIAKHAHGPVKIGISQNPSGRISSMQTGSPIEIYLAYSARCEVAYSANQIERRAHEILGYRRKRGEWFDCTVKDAVSAVMQAADELGFFFEQELDDDRPILNHDLAAKEKAIKMISEGMITVLEAARSIGIRTATVHSWVKGVDWRAARWARVKLE